MRMEDAGTSDEEDANSQECSIPMDRGHLARNYLNCAKVYNWDKLDANCMMLPTMLTRSYDI